MVTQYKYGVSDQGAHALKNLIFPLCYFLSEFKPYANYCH